MTVAIALCIAPPLSAEASGIDPDQRPAAGPHLQRPADESTAVPDSPTLIVHVGEFELHVPRAYINGFDGFQSKSGYLAIKAELPCLTPLTGEDPALSGHGWGDVVAAKISLRDPHERVGPDILTTLLQNSPVRSDDGRQLPSHEQNDRLAHGAEATLYEIADYDFFDLEVNGGHLVLQCLRWTPYVLSPYCDSRSLIRRKLLLDYKYGRSLIVKSLEPALSLDDRMHALVERFLDSPEHGQAPTAGVCD